MTEHTMAQDCSEEDNRIYLITKRLLDIILTFISLIIVSPIIIIAAITIRLESPGNPFFVQTRVGWRGKPFKIIKIRGMFIDARNKFPELYDYSNRSDLNFFFHHEVDPRVTATGRFVRKTSIDELPNLINVLKGEMSLVGPRPEIPEVMALYGKYSTKYLSVKPGITCLSKCTGRDALTKEETIKLDLDYVERRSLGLDLAILWKTFLGVLHCRNVH